MPVMVTDLPPAAMDKDSHRLRYQNHIFLYRITNNVNVTRSTNPLINNLATKVATCICIQSYILSNINVYTCAIQCKHVTQFV